jgi:putative transposase
MDAVSPWHFILAVLAGWVHREQVKVIEYLQAENRALREQLGNRRLRFTDEQRRRLAVKGHPLGRKALRELGPIVTPDTILRWYRELIAEKYDGSEQRKMGRPRTPDELQDLVTRMARENPGWGYTRIRDVRVSAHRDHQDRRIVITGIGIVITGIGHRDHRDRHRDHRDRPP